MRKYTKEPQRTLGYYLRLFRDRVGLSQEMATEGHSISPQYLSAIEKGHKVPSQEMLDRLMDAYELNDEERVLLSSLRQLEDERFILRTMSKTRVQVDALKLFVKITEDKRYDDRIAGLLLTRLRGVEKIMEEEPPPYYTRKRINRQ